MTYFCRLYQCMLNRKSLACTATLTREEKKRDKGSMELEIGEVEKPELGRSELYNHIFTCTYQQQESKLSCLRLLRMNCADQIWTLTFRLVNDSSCVGIRWRMPGESLTSLDIEKCNSTCNTTPRNTSYPKPFLNGIHLQPVKTYIQHATKQTTTIVMMTIL